MSDPVFKALADPTRRGVLDLLRERGGRNVSEIDAEFPELSRFGTAKHLKVLQDCGLVTVIADGRNRRYFLNAVPLQEVANRWLTQFTAQGAQALLNLRSQLEVEHQMTTPATDTQTVFTILIKTSQERLWQALTDTDVPRNWMYGSVMSTALHPGAAYSMSIDGFDLITGTVIDVEPPRRLSMTFDAHWDEQVDAESPGELEYRIEQAEGVCTLTVIIRGVEGATAASVASDTPEIYSGLKTWLETGEPLRPA